MLGLHRSPHDRELLDAALSLGVSALDTAYNYHRFGSHRLLHRVAGELLDQFHLSTKVGFFPPEAGGADNRHSIERVALRGALERTVADLHRVPDLVLLHNPEIALLGLDPVAAGEMLLGACRTLSEAVANGLCRSWGISSWDPRPLVRAMERLPEQARPRPAVVMVRAGMLVRCEVLDASERLFALLALPPDGRWGMSPFGGDSAATIWNRVDPRVLLVRADHEPAKRAQATVRVALALPEVDRIAVSTGSGEHLRDVVVSATLRIDPDRVVRYRQLLRNRLITSTA